MINEYSTDAKYQVFELDLSNGLKDYEINTILVSNFLTTFYVDNSGNSINTGKVNISFNSGKNYGLTFLNGSKYKSQYQKIWLNCDAQPNTNLRIFTSVDCFYEKEQPVTNAILTPPIIIQTDTLNYNVSCLNGTINGLTDIVIGQNGQIDGNNVKGISSILISNNDNSDIMYFGNNFTITDYSQKATAINPAEKLSLNFNPLCKAPFTFKLFATNNIDYQITVSYAY